MGEVVGGAAFAIAEAAVGTKGLTKLGSFGKVAKTADKVENAANLANGGKYAFGLKNEVISFADEISATHLMKDPNWKSTFINIINDSKNELHFTLSGIDETPMQMILNPGRSGINWEMNALYNSPAFENTIFYYGGNTYKGFEVFKIKP